MTKFEEIFNRGMPMGENINCNVEVSPLYLEWQKFHDESLIFLEKTRNRVPIVNFKIRQNGKP